MEDLLRRLWEAPQRSEDGVVAAEIAQVDREAQADRRGETALELEEAGEPRAAVRGGGRQPRDQRGVPGHGCRGGEPRVAAAGQRP